MSSIGAATSLPALIGFASRSGGWRILYFSPCAGLLIWQASASSAYATSEVTMDRRSFLTAMFGIASPVDKTPSEAVRSAGTIPSTAAASQQRQWRFFLAEAWRAVRRQPRYRSAVARSVCRFAVGHVYRSSGRRRQGTLIRRLLTEVERTAEDEEHDAHRRQSNHEHGDRRSWAMACPDDGGSVGHRPVLQGMAPGVPSLCDKRQARPDVPSLEASIGHAGLLLFPVGPRSYPSCAKVQGALFSSDNVPWMFRYFR